MQNRDTLRRPAVELVNPLEDFEEEKKEVMETEQSIDFPEETIVRRLDLPEVTPGGPPTDKLLESSTLEPSFIERPAD